MLTSRLLGRWSGRLTWEKWRGGNTGQRREGKSERVEKRGGAIYAQEGELLQMESFVRRRS